MVKFEKGSKVIVWEPGKPIIITGTAGQITSEGPNTYVQVDGKGPYHTAFVFKATLRNEQLIKVFNEQYSALETAKHTMVSIAMLAFREDK